MKFLGHIFTFIFATLICFGFGFSSFASIDSNGSKFCLTKLDEMREVFAKMERKNGLGPRGMLANNAKPPFTPESRVAALELGINYWAQRFKVVSDTEAAIAYDATQKDPLLKPAYLTGDIDFGSIQKREEALLQFTGLLLTGAFFIVDGVRVEIPLQDIERLFGQRGVRVGEFNKNDFGYLQAGWFFTKVHGVSLYQDLERSSAGVRVKSRSFMRRGFRVTFNQAFEASIIAISKQTRKGILSTRYDESYLNVLRGLYASGFAYSAEVWNPEGQLVAGEVGFKSGNIFKPDSVHYDENQYSVEAVALAKMASLALIDRLHDSGVDFLDTGMATNFSKKLGAKYISQEEYLAQLEALKHLPLTADLNSPWDWIEADRAVQFDPKVRRAANRQRGIELRNIILRNIKLSKEATELSQETTGSEGQKR